MWGMRNISLPPVSLDYPLLLTWSDLQDLNCLFQLPPPCPQPWNWALPGPPPSLRAGCFFCVKRCCCLQGSVRPVQGSDAEGGSLPQPSMRSSCHMGICGLLPVAVCPQGPLPCGHSCPEGRRLLEWCWGRGRAEAATFLGQGDLESVWGRAGGGAAIGLRRRSSGDEAQVPALARCAWSPAFTQMACPHGWTFYSGHKITGSFPPP